MAEVFLAIQRGPGGFEKLVAIKQLLPELVEEPGFVEMFLDEARIAAHLTHPNICQTFELGQEGGRYFIAMEYLSGVPLSRLWKKSLKEGLPLPPSLAAWVVARAAQGLAHAHEVTTPDGKPLRVVHRDVSPDNIVVTYDGLVKVVDFGIAKAANRMMKTRTGVVKGKLAYMSPEQAQGQELDARADVYSLGAVLYEVLAHEPMMRAEGGDLETMKRVVAGQRPSLKHRPGVPHALAHAVELATSTLPALRPSAHELAAMIDDAIRTLKPLPGSEALAAHVNRVFAAERAEEQSRLKTAAAPDIEDFLFRTPPKGVEVVLDATPEPKPGTRRLGLPLERPRRGWLVAGVVAAVLAAAGGGYAVLRARGARTQTSPAVPPSPAPTGPSALTAPPPPAAGPNAEALAATGPRAGAPAEPVDGAPTVEPSAASTASIAGAAAAAATASPDASAPAHVAAVTSPRPAVEHPGPKPARPRPHRAAEREEAEVGTGKLTFDTVPWTDVFLGGRKLGTTPLVEVELPSGTHQLRLVNREAGIDRRYEVVIRANQLVTLPRTRL